MIVAYYPGAGGHRYVSYLLKENYTIPGIAYDTSAVFGDIKDYIINTNKYFSLDFSNTIDKKSNSKTFTLTHCLNYEKINNIFPGEPIVLIDSELKNSLQRQWQLLGQDLYNKTEYKYNTIDVYNELKNKNWPYWPVITSDEDFKTLPAYIIVELEKAIEGHEKYSGKTYDKINSAFSMIDFHKKYYDQYKETLLSDRNVTVVNCKKITTQSTSFEKFMIGELQKYSSDCIFNFAWDAYHTFGPDAPIIDLWTEQIRKSY